MLSTQRETVRSVPQVRYFRRQRKRLSEMTAVFFAGYGLYRTEDAGAIIFQLLLREFPVACLSVWSADKPWLTGNQENFGRNFPLNPEGVYAILTQSIKKYPLFAEFCNGGPR